MDKKKIEAEFDCDVSASHCCESNPFPDSIGIVHVTRSDTEPHEDWYLASFVLATEYDVRHGEADELGETISASQLLIEYCPFCGAKLRDLD